MTNRHRSFGMAAAVVVSCLVSAARPARADSTFPQLVEQWSVLTLAGPPHPVEGLRLSAGHLTLTSYVGGAKASCRLGLTKRAGKSFLMGRVSRAKPYVRRFLRSPMDASEPAARCSAGPQTHPRSSQAVATQGVALTRSY